MSNNMAHEKGDHPAKPDVSELLREFEWEMVVVSQEDGGDGCTGFEWSDGAAKLRGCRLCRRRWGKLAE